MWKLLLASLLVGSPVLAESGTAYDAMRVIGTRFGRDAVNRVISVTGVNGDPQPGTWKVLLEDRRARGGVREVEVADGRIVSERTPVSHHGRINRRRDHQDRSSEFGFQWGLRGSQP